LLDIAEQPYHPEFQYSITLSLLSKDKKFMTRLKGFGDEFCRSYEALIELNKKEYEKVKQ